MMHAAICAGCVVRSPRILMTYQNEWIMPKPRPDSLEPAAEPV
jgi:hypothetical protein